MTTVVTPLDCVIRHVGKETEANGPAEKIVCLDVQNRRILDKPPLYAFLLDLRYYLVATADDPRNVAHSELSGVMLRNVDDRLPVTIAYSVRCRRGNESRAALALFDPAHSLTVVLESHLQKWIVDIGQSDIPAFVTRYLEDRASIEAELGARALAETGLDLTARVSLDWERSLAPIQVNREHLRVLTSDFEEEEQDLGIRVALEVDDRRRREAILRYRDHQKLQDLVPREVLRFFRKHVTMQMFATELASAALRQRLTQQLDQALAPYGRRVGPLKLTTQAPPRSDFFEGEHSVTCELHEYPKPVAIHCKVQMTRADEAAFRASKVSDLQKWLEEKLERHVHQRLFSARYIDVLTSFPRYEKAIRAILEEEARAIGYNIEQLITGPDLEPMRWRDPFPIEIEGTAFETRLSGFYVKLQFAVTARLPRLDSEKIRKFLNRDQNVPQAMRDAIVVQARRALHNIEPERFYMRFNFSEQPDEKPVEEMLVDAIRTSLETGFDAEVYDVVVKMAETELISRLRKLMETICPLVVEMTSLHGRETLVFRGNFQIDSVAAEGWPRFQLLTIGLEDMRKLLEEHLRAELSALTPDEMLYRDPRHRKQLEAVFIALAMRFVRQQFGLVIRVMNVQRDPTPQERAANLKLLGDDQRRIEVEADRRDQWAAAQILENHERAERLARLYEQRRLLTTESGTDEEVAELDRKIEAEKAALVPPSIPTFDDVKQKVLPGPAAGATLRDVARLAGLDELLTGEKRQLLEGETE
jgi:hypothetical protein